MRSNESDVFNVSQFKYFFLVYSILCNFMILTLLENVKKYGKCLTFDYY